jgi:hypothetical protein
MSRTGDYVVLEAFPTSQRDARPTIQAPACTCPDISLSEDVESSERSLPNHCHGDGLRHWIMTELCHPMPDRHQPVPSVR